MATSETIKTIREGLTPSVTIVSFKDKGQEIVGEARFEINGFGFPVIQQSGFKADKEGKLLALYPGIQFGIASTSQKMEVTKND